MSLQSLLCCSCKLHLIAHPLLHAQRTHHSQVLQNEIRKGSRRSLEMSACADQLVITDEVLGR